MANLADDIEQYLKRHLERQPVIEVQRAVLAAQFGCAPSQINYVLATRFTPERGYLVESRRGGGGYIRIIRLNLEEGDALHVLINREIGDSLSQEEALGYICRLREQNIIDEREAAIMQAAVQRETIRLDLPLRDILRANLLKAMILAILRF
jgi:transcriptional regulator CtsR